MRILTLLIVLTFKLPAQDTSYTLPQSVIISESEYDEIQDTIIYEDNITVNNDVNLYKTQINGRIMTAMVTESGDTLIMEQLDDISITSLRSFKSEEDYRKYMKFRRYAALVYPYAKEAIKIFRETEHVTETMNKRKRKKHIKKLQEDLSTKFDEPLKKLTKLQGKILIKMIERELDKNMYELIAGLRGKFTAFYWHNASKLYSYDLKEGYQEGTYEILDAVLKDFDVSYRIEQDELKNK